MQTPRAVACATNCRSILCRSRSVSALVLLSVLVLTPATVLFAQNGANNALLNNGFYGRAVGGISINADGLLDNVSVDALGKLAQTRAQALEKVPADLMTPVPLRKVSLRRLEAAIEQCLKENKPLPDDIMFLGGLQQIRYVFAYPEQQDIVLVGPGEGWRVDNRGNMVGASTGRPVMMLDDLLVALRTAQGSAQAGITCSIDPTAEGLQQLKTYLAKQRTIGNPQQTAANIEQSLGRQQITFTGVPATSHLARVLIAADYRMKRLAMNFEPSPVRALPSFLQMVSAGSVRDDQHAAALVAGTDVRGRVA